MEMCAQAVLQPSRAAGEAPLNGSRAQVEQEVEVMKKGSACVSLPLVRSRPAAAGCQQQMQTACDCFGDGL